MEAKAGHGHSNAGSMSPALPQPPRQSTSLLDPGRVPPPGALNTGRASLPGGPSGPLGALPMRAH
eukprot:3339576-Amphidinium_carterae.1